MNDHAKAVTGPVDLAQVRRLAQELQVEIPGQDSMSDDSHPHVVGGVGEWVQRADTLLLPGLARRIQPFVRGALSRWGQVVLRVERRDFREWVTNSTIQHSHWCAFALWHGTCDCPRETMRRDKDCGLEHSLWSWRASETLDEFLIRSVIGCPYPNVVPHDGARFNLAFKAADKANGARKGMLAGQVMWGGRSMWVGSIPKCRMCGTEVTVDNACLCSTRGGLPQAVDTEYVFFVEGERIEFDDGSRSRVGTMFRCERCRFDGRDAPRQTRKIKDERLLFFRLRDSGLCPKCQQPLKGHAIHVQVRTSDWRNHQPNGVSNVSPYPWHDAVDPADVPCMEIDDSLDSPTSRDGMWKGLCLHDREAKDRLSANLPQLRAAVSGTPQVSRVVDALEQCFRPSREAGDSESAFGRLLDLFENLTNRHQTFLTDKIHQIVDKE